MKESGSAWPNSGPASEMPDNTEARVRLAFVEDDEDFREVVGNELADHGFDVVFLDPPYRAGWIERMGPLLPGLLCEGGVVYVEAEYKIENIDRLMRIKQGTAGQVYYHLFAAAR